jgi:hypothetical protein
MSISSRISYKVVDSVDKKSTFPTQTSYPSPKAKKVFGQYHNKPQLSARLVGVSSVTCRDGEKVPFFFVDVHLQR